MARTEQIKPLAQEAKKLNRLSDEQWCYETAKEAVEEKKGFAERGYQTDLDEGCVQYLLYCAKMCEKYLRY